MQPFSAFGIVVEIREGVSKWLIDLEGGQMKLARIVAPFSLSAVLFILSYLSLKDIESGFYSIMLLIIGIALAAVGTTAIFSNK